MHDRIYEFVADDVQMIVSTDHNVISDYDPFIRELDAGRFIASAVGDEMTTDGWGHFGAFPLPRELSGPARATLVHGRDPRGLLQGRAQQRARRDHRRAPPAHRQRDRLLRPRPLRRALRSRGAPGLFLGLRRGRGHERLPGPGAQERRQDHRRLVLAAQPRPHGDRDRQLRHAPPDVQHRRLPAKLRAACRTTGPQRADPKQVADAVRNHHAFFTTGPFVRVCWSTTARSAIWLRRAGATRTPTSTVQAAPWVSVSRVTLYVNGQRGQALGRPPGRGRGAISRRARGRPRRATATSWCASTATSRCSPVVGDGKTFTAYPFALTNPVFLDVDGDGKYRTGQPHGH